MGPHWPMVEPFSDQWRYQAHLLNLVDNLMVVTQSGFNFPVLYTHTHIHTLFYIYMMSTSS